MRLPVWAYLVFGPYRMAIFAPFIDRSTRDGLNIAFLSECRSTLEWWGSTFPELKAAHGENNRSRRTMR